MLGIFLFFGGVLIGVLFGFWIVRGLFIRKLPIGALRVDRSDPEDGPYLFLELYPGGKEAIMCEKYVVLSVKLEDYIPRN